MFVTWVSEVLTSGEEDIEALLGAKRQMKYSSRVLSLHNGRTVAPEAILFESPCRAHPET